MSVPTLAVMFGILLNRQEATALRAEIAQLRSETIALRDSIHRDMIGLYERLAVVESKQNS